jgi:hypothetical protein
VVPGVFNLFTGHYTLLITYLSPRLGAWDDKTSFADLVRQESMLSDRGWLCVFVLLALREGTEPTELEVKGRE